MHFLHGLNYVVFGVVELVCPSVAHNLIEDVCIFRPVCSYILGERMLCLSTAVEVCLCLILHGWCRAAELLFSSVCRSLIPGAQRAVGSNPTEGSLFSLKKVVLGVVESFPLSCCR